MALIHDIQERQKAVSALLGQLYNYHDNHFGNQLIPRYSVAQVIRELEALQLRLKYALEVEEAEGARKLAEKPKTKGRLRLLFTVASDIPILPRGVAKARIYNEDEIQTNRNGAVSVMTPNGWLGIKPDEFVWCDEHGKDLP